MASTTYYGNSWIGMFLRTNENLTLVPQDAVPKLTTVVQETLKTQVLSVSIGHSNLLGLYCVMNRNGIVLPNVTTDEELAELKQTGLNLYRSPERFNAHGNNIAVNDTAGLISEWISREEKKRMEDALGVELVPMRIARYSTVGSTCLVTNRGWLAHYGARSEEEAQLETIFKTRGGKGSLNMGAGFVGMGAVAHSKGYLAGEDSSAFEQGRLEEALGFL